MKPATTKSPQHTLRGGKRPLAVLLALLMALSMLGIALPAFATEGVFDYTTSVVIDDENNKVSLTIGVENNPGLGYALFRIDYPKDIVKYEKIEYTGLGNQFINSNETVADYPSDGYLNVFLLTQGNRGVYTGTVSDDGDFFTVEFSLLGDVLEGDHFEIGKPDNDVLFRTPGGTAATNQIHLPGRSVVFFGNNILVSSITLDKNAATIKTNETLQLAPTILPTDATNQELDWTSSDETVATVSTNGLVTPKKSGTTTITATAKDGSGESATCEVTVQDVVSAVQIIDSTGSPAYKPIKLTVGETAALYARVLPVTVANQNVTWSSSDTEVATVGGDTNDVAVGDTLTALSPGITTITVTSEDGNFTSRIYAFVVPEGDDAAPAARIGTTDYDTLADAITALQAGDTLILLKDQLAEGPLTISQDCSVDLNGYTLIFAEYGLTIADGATVDSFTHGTLYGGTTYALSVQGNLGTLSGCTIFGGLSTAVGAEIDSIENCEIKSSQYGIYIEYDAIVHAIRDSIVVGGYGAPDSRPIHGWAAIYSRPHGAVRIYSGVFENTGYKEPTNYALYILGNDNGQHTSIVEIYGGSFRGHTMASSAVIMPGYKLSATADEYGYWTVEPNVAAAANVSFTTTPTSATVTLYKVAGGELETATDGVYSLKQSVMYAYTVSAAGYTTKSGMITPALPQITIPITLLVAGSGNETDEHVINGGSVIAAEGIYTLAEGATGTIAITTTDPVTIVGKGIAEGDRFDNITIECIAATDLTLQDVWIRNNFGEGTASGETNPGEHILNFTGAGNILRFVGENVLENQEYVSNSGIHVPKGAELTFAGPDTLYVYKYSEGSGIGGDAHEASGAITFAAGKVFVKGSKTGALVGGDASGIYTDKNDDITISGGEVFLVNTAMGAALGASSQGTCSGNVYLTGGNLTIVSDWTGAAIGNGGGGGINGTFFVSGGTFKAVRTANSLGGGKPTQTDDSLVRATKLSPDGKALHLLVFDTAQLKVPAQSFDVSVDNVTFATGLILHGYRYTPSTTTVNNFTADTTDKNLYLYLPMVETQQLVVNGEAFTATWNAADDTFVVTPAPTVGAPKSGDLDGDGKTTLDDALQLVQIINNDAFATLSEGQLAAMDANGDGYLTMADVLLVVQIVLRS